MNILAIETATDACSVALLSGPHLLVRRAVEAKRHSEELLSLIDSLLKEARIVLSEVDALAVNVGPGSFSGIRIGIGVAQGLSFGMKVPVLTMNTFELLAYKAFRQEHIEEGTIAIDAKMGEAFVAQFTIQNHEPVLTNVPLIEKVSQLTPEAVWVTCGLEAHRNRLKAIELEPSAYELAILARRRFEAGQKGVSALMLEPLYIRETVAQAPSAA